MKSRRVALAPRAEADLDSIAAWIADHGAPMAALAYVSEIRRYIEGFGQFPERGMRHSGIRAGLRTATFERRVTIAFIVRQDLVEIERIFYGGQDWERALRHEGDSEAGKDEPS